jgi:Transglycosylase SLT domain
MYYCGSGSDPMRLLRLILRLLKGVYDLLATYLLAWVLLFALLAWCFQLLLGGAVSLVGDFASTESFWNWVRRALPVNVTLLRLAVFGLLHLIVFWTLRRRIVRLKAWVERGADRLIARYRRWSNGGRAAAGGLFSLFVSALLVPFVVQPTLVPLNLSGRAWASRAANLADGSATDALVESVVGLYRKLYAEPAVTDRGVTPDEFDESLHGIAKHELGAGGPGGPPPASRRRRPLMDRWDPLIWKVVGGDRRAFARVKAFMWVESGGQQFAVSSTGCSGLMQFCSRTARSGGFRRVFGLGQVYPCSCRGRCGVSRRARRELESGDPERIAAQRRGFPCDLSDARFDPRKSIKAGHLYVRRLAKLHGGNILVMYVGYNSGPAVAKRLWSALRRDAKADLQSVARHLPAALAPYYGSAAAGRARSLVRVHLPKLARAYRLYHSTTPPSSDQGSGLAGRQGKQRQSDRIAAVLEVGVKERDEVVGRHVGEQVVRGAEDVAAAKAQRRCAKLHLLSHSGG